FELWTAGVDTATRRAGELVAPPKFVTGGPDARVTLATLTDANDTLLVRLPAQPGAPMQLLLRMPAYATFEKLIVRQDGGEAAFLVSAGNRRIAVGAVPIAPRPLVRMLTPGPGFLGEQVAYSPSGRVLFSWGPTPEVAALAENPVGSGHVTAMIG